MKNKRISIPNILTFIRLLLVPAYWVLFFNSSVWWALGVFVLASVTDVLDGRIARKYNMITPLGKVLDPFADKIMQISVMLSIVIHGALHYVFAVLIIIKETYMIVCSFLLLKKDIVVYSNIFGKTATVALFISFFVMFLEIGFQQSGLAVWQTMNVVGTILVAISLVLSWIAAVMYTVKVVQQLKGKKLDGNQKIDIKF